MNDLRTSDLDGTVVPVRPAHEPVIPSGAPKVAVAEPRRAVVTTSKGRRIAYVETGSGPPVVLIHGTLTTADDMDLGVMTTLAPTFRCVAVDRPGHGWSDHVRGGDASLWSQAATIRDAVRALGLTRPVICGHSFGGAVALAYGMAYGEEVAGVVALAPICFPELRFEQILFGPRALPAGGDVLSSVLGATLDPVVLPLLWQGMFLPQAMPERFAAGFPFARAGRPCQIVAEAENASALWPDLTRSAFAYPLCRVPVHIVCGSADVVVNPLTQGALAAALIPGARFKLLAGIGHMLHHVRHEAVMAAVQEVFDAAGG